MALGIVKIYLETPFSANQRCSRSVCLWSVGLWSVVMDPRIRIWTQFWLVLEEGFRFGTKLMKSRQIFS